MLQSIPDTDKITLSLLNHILENTTRIIIDIVTVLVNISQGLEIRLACSIIRYVVAAKNQHKLKLISVINKWFFQNIFLIFFLSG
jgi:hypothetical protein